MRPSLAVLLACSLLDLPAAHPAELKLQLSSKVDRIEITAGRKPLATYVFADRSITRPYYAHIHSPAGVQLTRTHPPVAGVDKIDHADMHPGIWLAFGDIGGADVWRNKAQVVHDRFIAEPALREGSVSFTVLNRYQNGGRVICIETARHEFRQTSGGLLLALDSTFTSERPFFFGDQEEMGLGVRMATPLTVASGGRILDSEGRRNEAGIWGNTALWCDYGGRLDGREAGLLLMPHPDNPLPSRWHVRDYGLMVANPFGNQSFNKGNARRTTVNVGQHLRLRFGMLLRDGQATLPELKAAYERYLAMP